MLKIKNFTEEEFNELTEGKLSQVIIASNDGQGDTSLDDLNEILAWYEPQHIDGKTNVELLNMMFEDLGGNMVKCAWVEDNSIMKLIIN